MRRLGEDLGVEAISIYNHVANKDDLTNGMAEVIFGEIELPSHGEAGGAPSESARSPSARSWPATPGRPPCETPEPPGTGHAPTP